MYWLLVLILISSSYGTNLVWIPNHAGLFSQFLQLKLIYNRSSLLNRNIVIAPQTSRHYGADALVLCDLLVLPSDILCLKPAQDFKPPAECSDNFEHVLSVVAFNDSCYDGSYFFGSISKTQDWEYMVRAVDLELRFQPLPKYELPVKILKATLGHDLAISTKVPSLIVAHWRRGDQIRSRCKKGMDTSVNCRSAHDLIDLLRRYSNNSSIYVATNEPEDSSEVMVLNSHEIFTFSSISSYSFLGDLRPIDIFMVEVKLMLDADTFLGWGISEVNNVIEHERMLRGKSYCIDQPSAATTQFLTWCNFRLSQLQQS